MAPLMLGASHYFIVVGGIVLVFTFIFIANVYHWGDMYAELAIKRFERSFGFVVGAVVVSDHHGQRRRWGVVSVVPDGALDRAGIRAGDIPFERGASVFYRALSDAAEGRQGEIDVVNAADHGMASVVPVRTVIVPPLKR